MKKILLIDDDIGFQKIIKMGCERINIKLDTCFVTDFTFEKITRNHYDAVLLDMRMEPKDGLTLASEIKHDFDIPVYIMSNYEKEFIEKEAKERQVDFDGFVSKSDSLIDFIEGLIYV